jgi:4-hydroxy-tetrahydrodipicolinate synthase
MLPATVQRLSQLPGIVAVKEAVADQERVRELVALCHQDFAILSGDDASARRSVLAGARGLISVTANVAPRAMSDMVAAAMRGDAAAAERLDEPIAALHRDLFLEANPIPAKWALMRMGMIGSGIRLPLTELSAQYQPAVLAALATAGVLD